MTQSGLSHGLKLVLRVATSAHRSTPVNRNELGELPSLIRSGHEAALRRRTARAHAWGLSLRFTICARVSKLSGLKLGKAKLDEMPSQEPEEHDP